VPHLAAGRGTDDDRVLDPRSTDALLSRPALVEEKLDGANVMLWREGTRVECSLRSGPGSRDRAGQLGPLRAWTGEHYAPLLDLLDEGRVLYAEWLLLQHTVAYDALPDYLVGLDVAGGDGRFLAVAERDALLDAAGVPGPPVVSRGVPGSLRALEGLMGRSAYGGEPMEGVVVRPEGGDPRAAKLLRPGFVRLGDDAWRGGRPRNRLRAAGPVGRHAA
jgi:hypothetical protein